MQGLQQAARNVCAMTACRRNMQHDAVRAHAKWRPWKKVWCREGGWPKWKLHKPIHIPNTRAWMLEHHLITWYSAGGTNRHFCTHLGTVQNFMLPYNTSKCLCYNTHAQFISLIPRPRSKIKQIFRPGQGKLTPHSNTLLFKCLILLLFQSTLCKGLGRR